LPLDYRPMGQQGFPYINPLFFSEPVFIFKGLF